MIKIKKDYNLKVILITTLITFYLYCNVVYAITGQLRVPLGGSKRVEEAFSVSAPNMNLASMQGVSFLDENLKGDLSNRHDEFEKIAEVNEASHIYIPFQDPVRKYSKVKIIFSDLGRDRTVYHFKTRYNSFIIVLNSEIPAMRHIPDDIIAEFIRRDFLKWGEEAYLSSMAIYYAAREIFWEEEKGYSLQEAHLIAKSELRLDFAFRLIRHAPDFIEYFVNFYEDLQILLMDEKQLEIFAREDEKTREWQYSIMEKVFNEDEMQLLIDLEDSLRKRTIMMIGSSYGRSRFAHRDKIDSLPFNTIINEGPDLVDLLYVGPYKPVGYLLFKSKTLENKKGLIDWLNRNGLKTQIKEYDTFGRAKEGWCWVWAYHKEALQELIDGNKNILEKAGVSLDADNFINYITSHVVTDKKARVVVDLAFSDLRVKNDLRYPVPSKLSQAEILVLAKAQDLIRLSTEPGLPENLFEGLRIKLIKLKGLFCNL